VLRDPRPGDLGWITHRQAVLYASEHGCDWTCEALIAEILTVIPHPPGMPGRAGATGHEKITGRSHLADTINASRKAHRLTASAAGIQP
jgi:hypothetical protein